MKCLFDTLYLDAEHEDNTAINRARLGQELGKWCPADVDFIVPIPETAILFAQGYSLSLGIPLLNAVLKKRPKHKTLFIDNRKKTMGDVFFTLPELLSGKRIVIVDETVISGLSLSVVLRKVKAAHPKEIHIRLVAPPMIRECPFGKSGDWQFIYRNYRKFFGVDSFCYLPIEILNEYAQCTLCYGGRIDDTLA